MSIFTRRELNNTTNSELISLAKKYKIVGNRRIANSIDRRGIISSLLLLKKKTTTSTCKKSTTSTLKEKKTGAKTPDPQKNISKLPLKKERKKRSSTRKEKK